MSTIYRYTSVSNINKKDHMNLGKPCTCSWDRVIAELTTRFCGEVHCSCTRNGQSELRPKCNKELCQLYGYKLFKSRFHTRMSVCVSLLSIAMPMCLTRANMITLIWANYVYVQGIVLLTHYTIMWRWGGDVSIWEY